MEITMLLRIEPTGYVCCLYGEAVDLSALGPVTIRRVSQVEPDAEGRWHADLSPVGGPRLGPFPLRSQALAAEVRWLEEHLLSGPSSIADPTERLGS
jgi:hypothetical protein